jgi:2-oxoisovalerate dehydrogenase E1 component
VVLEPIALYAVRDLDEEGDGLWLTPYPDPSERIPFGEVGVHGRGRDIALVTFGNGHRLARQAQRRLAEMRIDARVIDLRWLAPLPETGLRAALEGCRAALVVDETRRTGGISEGLATFLSEQTTLPHARLTATDSFIATGPAHAATLPSAPGIVAAATALLETLPRGEDHA